MGFKEVKAYLNQAGYGDRVTEFTVSSATVELAAQALHCPSAWIAKTLSFMVGEQAMRALTTPTTRRSFIKRRR